MKKIQMLNRAVDQYNIEQVNALVADNTDVNEDHEGFTPLIIASCCDYTKIVRILLKAGADVKKKGKRGQTALHYAKSNLAVQILISHGSDVYDIDDEGCTPLHRACEHADLRTIKCLLKNGADLNALDCEGRTPLMRVLVRPEPSIKKYMHIRSSELLEFLLDHSNVNTIDKNGNNILNVKQERSPRLIYVLMHLAKLKVLDCYIHQSVLDLLSNEKELTITLGIFIQELLRAKSMTFPNSWVSFFNLLVDEKKKLIKYAGNQDIVKNFDKIKTMRTFDVYGEKMGKNFTKAMKNRKIWDNAAISLCNQLPVFNIQHLVIRDILDCLTAKDLSKLL